MRRRSYTMPDDPMKSTKSHSKQTRHGGERAYEETIHVGNIAAPAVSGPGRRIVPT